MDYAYKYGEHLIRVQDDVPQTGLDVRNLWNKVNGTVEYGVTNKFTIGAEFPVSFNAREEGYKKNYYTGFGFGDVTMKGSYWFKNYDPRNWNFYASASLAIPTGSDAERDANGAWKKPYIVPGSGQWTPGVSVGVQKGFGFDQGATRYNVSATIGRVWTLGKNDAGYDSSDAWFGSAGMSWIPGHFGVNGARYFGVGLYLTQVRIAGWDTRDGVIVSNTGGRWLDLDPAVYFTPDAGKFAISVAFAHPIWTKVHSLQTAQSISYSAGLSYRF